MQNLTFQLVSSSNLAPLDVPGLPIEVRLAKGILRP